MAQNPFESSKWQDIYASVNPLGTEAGVVKYAPGKLAIANIINSLGKSYAGLRAIKERENNQKKSKEFLLAEAAKREAADENKRKTDEERYRENLALQIKKLEADQDFRERSFAADNAFKKRKFESEQAYQDRVLGMKEKAMGEALRGAARGSGGSAEKEESAGRPAGQYMKYGEAVKIVKDMGIKDPKTFNFAVKSLVATGELPPLKSSAGGAAKVYNATLGRIFGRAGDKGQILDEEAYLKDADRQQSDGDLNEYVSDAADKIARKARPQISAPLAAGFIKKFGKSSDGRYVSPSVFGQLVDRAAAKFGLNEADKRMIKEMYKKAVPGKEHLKQGILDKLGTAVK